MSNDIQGKEIIQNKEVLQNMLLKMKPQIEMALPKFITAERLIRVATTAMSKQPKLLQCTPASLIGSIVQSAQLGLMPDGVLGEAYLVPFYNGKIKKLECQFIIGYRGFLTLAYRSGQVASFQARPVYEKDTFDYSFGIEDRLNHVPSKEKERGELTYVYAVIKFKGGGYVFDVMNRSELETAKLHTKSRDANGNIYGTWVEYFDEMCIKTIIRRISKRTPLSSDFMSAVTLDEQVEVAGVSQDNSALLLDFDTISDLHKEVSEEMAIKAQAEKSNTPTAEEKAKLATDEAKKMLGKQDEKKAVEYPDVLK